MSPKSGLHVAALACACLSLHAADPSTGNLDGASGDLFHVDLDNQQFELLKETEYDPKTNIGQSRFTISWSDHTTFVKSYETKNFSAIHGSPWAKFYGIRKKDHQAFLQGKPLVARVAVIYPGFKQAPTKDPERTEVVGRFTPSSNATARAGTIEIDDQQIPVSLRQKHWRIYVREPCTPEDFTAGFWKTTIQGKYVDNQFVADHIEVTPKPDPRETDNPQLPRVLVIGDSISMNYHDAAKKALDGIANYHRIEGNAFTVKHGVRNANLWLGNHHEKGLHWDVIQFNHGLHDLKQSYNQDTDTWGEYSVPLDQYQKQLEQLIGILRQTGAKLIWCTTTPVPKDNKGRYARRRGAAAEFNRAAEEVIQKHPDILTTNLYDVISQSPVFDLWRQGNDVHFYRDEERQVLGETIAQTIRRALKQVKPTPQKPEP